MSSLPVVHTPIVQDFVDRYNNKVHISFRRFFDFAFKAVLHLATIDKTLIPIFIKYDIKSVDDFFTYMDRFVNWVPREDMTGTSVYDHLCMLHFILNLAEWLPFNEGYSQDPIDPKTQPPYLWMSQWLIRYAQDMGKWMNTSDSITDEAIKTFYAVEKYHMADYPVPKEGWKDFNDFFARRIDLAKRPIAPDTEDSIVITNPADCSFDGQWAVDENAVIFVKDVPWTIAQLLDDTAYGPKFAGGVFMHSFLGPADYHRKHAPVSGKIVVAKVISGLCYLEVVLNLKKKSEGDLGGLEMLRSISPEEKEANIANLKAVLGPYLDGINAELSAPEAPPVPTLLAPETPNTAGYQFLQARALILIDNPDLGLVAVLPVGMTQISSVELTVKEGDVVQKGDEISYFQFGGSDIVMVFQKDAQVTVDEKMELKEHRNFGQMVATAPRKKRD